MAKEPNRIVHWDDIQFHPWKRGEKFDAELGDISRRIGGGQLGYNITRVKPGKCAFPFHAHGVNEEMFFVVEGEGELRLGETTHKIRRGDFIACPPGGVETAHQLRNTSETELLVYLAVSTTESPEVAYYPDSDKYGVMHDGPFGALKFIVRKTATADDYWEGEDV